MFGKSLGRELGKNTGRVISNGLFGDKHASKSVHIIQGRLKIKAQEAEIKRENKALEREDKAIESAQVENIAGLTLSTNENELANQLNQVISLISGQKSRSVKKSGIEKVEFGITQLKSSENQLFFQKKIKKIKRKYNLVYYAFAIGVVILIIGSLFS